MVRMPFLPAMTGNGDGGDSGGFGKRGIDGNDAFNTAGFEETGILREEIGAVAMADDEVKEFLLEQRIFNAAEHGGGVTFADLRDHDADGEAALFAQAAGEGIGMVVERGGGLPHALLGGGGDSIFGPGLVEDARDGG